jgi:hypothetical protein
MLYSHKNAFLSNFCKGLKQCKKKGSGMASKKSVSNVEVTFKELAKAVATNESRDSQRNFL